MNGARLGGNVVLICGVFGGVAGSQRVSMVNRGAPRWLDIGLVSQLVGGTGGALLGIVLAGAAIGIAILGSSIFRYFDSNRDTRS